jgi:hypothetical protein
MTKAVSNYQFVGIQDDGKVKGAVDADDVIIVRDSDNQERQLPFGGAEATRFLAGLGVGDVKGSPIDRASYAIRTGANINASLNKASQLTASDEPGSLAAIFGYVTDAKVDSDNLLSNQGPNLTSEVHDRGSAILQRALANAAQRTQEALASGDLEKAQLWVEGAKDLIRCGIMDGFDVSWAPYCQEMAVALFLGRLG